MIKSITGYGRAESALDNKKMVVEIESLPQKNLEIYVRLPNSLCLLELDVKKRIGNRISRGRVEANIRIDFDQDRPEPHLELNLPLVQQYYALLSEIREELQVKGEVTLDIITGIKDAIKPIEAGTDQKEIRIVLEKVLDEAIDSLTLLREKEGESLCRNLLFRGKILRNIMDVINARAPGMVVDYQRRLSERIRELSGGIFPEKSGLAQEVAIIAERIDISEEIVRFGSHMDQLGGMLQCN